MARVPAARVVTPKRDPMYAVQALEAASAFIVEARSPSNAYLAADAGGGKMGTSAVDQSDGSDSNYSYDYEEDLQDLQEKSANALDLPS